MSKYDKDRLRVVFAKANGRCHLCGKTLAFANYGNHGTRGAWEVDHSVPVSRGGTDNLNNLYAAHTTCNRSKQARSNASVRQAYGRTRAPMSANAMKELKTEDAVVGAISGGLLGARFAGPPGMLIGAIIGAIGAYAVERESA